jgi:hypothetical protein
LFNATPCGPSRQWWRDASSPANIEEALTCLYGKMDGGGVIAIAIKDE